MSDEYARKDDPESSKEAAAVMNATALEDVAVEQMAKRGRLTTIEMASAVGLPRDSISPRMKNLVRKGIAINTGEKRIVEGSRVRCIVWALTPNGIDYAMRKGW